MDDAMEFQQLVGNRLRRKRQMLGLSQGALARRVGMPQSQLSRLERGAFSLVHLWQLHQLMEALLTTPNFLLGTSDDPGEVPLSRRPGAGEGTVAGAAPAPDDYSLTRRL